MSPDTIVRFTSLVLWYKSWAIILSSTHLLRTKLKFLHRSKNHQESRIRKSKRSTVNRKRKRILTPLIPWSVATRSLKSFLRTSWSSDMAKACRSLFKNWIALRWNGNKRGSNWLCLRFPTKAASTCAGNWWKNRSFVSGRKKRTTLKKHKRKS